MVAGYHDQTITGRLATDAEVEPQLNTVLFNILKLQN